MASLKPKVAVIGAGFAGITASIALTDAGVDVSLFEAQACVGGRARRVEGLTRLPDDNGQHISLGAYTRLLHYQKRVGIDIERVYRRLPLTLINARGEGWRAPAWPQPFHWLGFLLSGPGLSFSSRIAFAAWLLKHTLSDFTLEDDQALNDFLISEHLPEGAQRLFHDLSFAALNTSPDIASAKTFLLMLRDLFKGPKDASDLLLPRVDLSALYPEPALDWLKKRGASIHAETRVTGLTLEDQSITLQSTRGEASFDGVIIATHARGAIPLLRGHSKAFDSLAAALLNLAHERIATLTVAFDQAIQLPFPMIRGEGSVDWLFDRSALLDADKTNESVFTAVQSAIDQPDEDALLQDTLRTLELILGHRPKPSRHRLIHEKLATLSAIPNLKRPSPQTPHSRIVLSGDYTHAYLPSTLEGAVRAGETSAQLLLKGLD